ncbi:MAG: YfhO family protein [Chlorobi bacterium]|nr:YfhO family protein [Chlorobiota bacterium]
MGKQKRTSRRQSPSRSSDIAVPSFLQKHAHAIYISLIALLLIVFFHEAFFAGKVFHSADKISSIVYEHGYLEKAKQEGVNAFWNPYIFSGMPTWGSSIPGHGMYLHTFLDPLKPMLILQVYGWLQSIAGIFPLPDSFWDIFNYFLLGFFTYLFGLRRKFEPFAAFIAAVAVVFTIYTLNWVMAGHNTKITVYAWLPAILLLVDMLFERKSLLRIALLVLAFHFTFNSGHVQMIFYSGMTVFFYGLFKWYEGARIGNVLAVAGIVIGAAAFAFLMLSGPYFATWEYKDFSIRGAGSGGSGHEIRGGLDYDYATNWSFSFTEIATFFVPSFVGFGSPTYWGTMPFTESPVYLGIVVCFLALLGIILAPKSRFVHFWVFLGILVLLISLGRNFGLVYDLMFNYVPAFNNFRIPSMILFLVSFCVAMLAGVGVTEIVKNVRAMGKREDPLFRKKIAKVVWIPVALAGFLLLVLFLTGNSFQQTIAENLQKYQPQSWNLVQQVEQAFRSGQGNRVPEELKDATVAGIYGMALRDSMIAFLFMVLVGGTVWMFARRRMSLVAFQGALFVLLIVDLWIVDYKPMQMITKSVQNQQLSKTDVVAFLEKDKSLFRILPASAHGGDNWYVYFGIQSVAGYHPAKLKVYDDIRNTIFNEFRFTSPQQVDAANWALLSVLNTKYVIVPKDWELTAPWLRKVFEGQTESIYENMYVLPRAFFVNKVEVVPNDAELLALLDDLSKYQPQRTAYLSEPLEEEVAEFPDTLLQEMRARVTSFGINHIEFSVETPVDAVLKVSEVYYPSGWTATIDGKETKIYRTDYTLRAVRVPAGKHVLRMWFEPRSYKAGFWVTTITNYLLALILLAYAIQFIRRRFIAKARSKD